MKIYRDRWWQDPDRVTALIALGVVALLWSVVVLIVVLAVSRGQREPARERERTPEQVLPAPWEGEEELSAESEEQRV